MVWTLVQKSSAPGTNSSGTSAAPALPGGSTAGNLLIAVVTSLTEPDTISGPSGWVQAVKGQQSSAGTASIWYRANNPGSVSSATFTDSASSLADSWMAEFTISGAAGALLATSGTGSTSSGTTCTATATSSNPAGALAVCIFDQQVFGAGTWTTPSGWTLLDDDSGSIGFGWAGYQLSAASGTLSVTGQHSLSGAWAGAVATFTAGALIAGAASLAGAGSVAAAGHKAIPAAAALAAGGSVSAGGGLLVQAPAALSAAGAVTAAGTAAFATVAGAGQVTAGSDETLRAAAVLAAAGAVSGTPAVTSDNSGAFFSLF